MMDNEQIYQLISTVITYAPAVAVLMFQVWKQQTLINDLVAQVRHLSEIVFAQLEH